jgi:hypothetical protein
MAVFPRTKPLGECNFAPDWFEQHLAAPLRVPTVDQARAHEAIGELLRELNGDKHTFDIGAEVEQRRAGRLTDAHHWTPSLGDDGDMRCAGIARGDDNRLWVVARTGGGEPARALHRFVLANPTMSVGALIKTPEYTVARDYAQRNAQRVGALIAGALTSGALSTVVECRHDSAAAAAEGMAPPPLVVPTVHHTFNMLSDANMPFGSPANSVLYVRAEVNGAAPGSHVLVAHGADQGFVLRPLGADRNSAAPAVATRTHDEQQSNTQYWTRVSSNSAAHKHYVYGHFLTRGGQPLSSAARSLWGESSIGGDIGSGAIRLAPYVFVVSGNAARSANA